MSDIIDIVVQETIDSVDITVNPNIIEVNVTRTSGGGGGGSQNLQQVTDEGNTTTNDIIVSKETGTSFIQVENNNNTLTFQVDSADGSLIELNDTTNGEYGSITVGEILMTAVDASVQITYNYLGLSNNNAKPYIELSGSDGTLTGSVSIKTDLIDGSYEQQLPPKDGTFAMLDDVTGVPYTGATADVNLGEFGLLTGNIEFDNTPTNIPTGAGSMVWNDTDGTVDLKLKGGNVTLQIGQENVLRVVNKTATNINLLEANYQAVRVTGAQGQRLKVDLAQATSDTLSAETIGLVTETINNNQEGFITTSGLIRNVNTTGSLQSETWADGDILYLSPTVAGQITKVKPVAPNHLVIIGYVVSAHATQGSIFVKVDNGYELDELHNVKIASATNNELLAYTSSTDIWENKSISTILGYTPIKKIVSDTTSSSAVTGTTSETLCKTYTISENTFSDGDFMKCLVGLEKTGTAGTATVRIRVNQTNNFATATLVGTYTPSAGTHTAILFKRDFLSFKSGVLKGINFVTSTQNDLVSGASIFYNTTTLSPTSDFYIYVSVINTSSADSTIVNQVQITN